MLVQPTRLSLTELLISVKQVEIPFATLLTVVCRFFNSSCSDFNEFTSKDFSLLTNSSEKLFPISEAVAFTSGAASLNGSDTAEVVCSLPFSIPVLTFFV